MFAATKKPSSSDKVEEEIFFSEIMMLVPSLPDLLTV
jgi:hypothetical protein